MIKLLKHCEIENLIENLPTCVVFARSGNSVAMTTD